MEEKKHPTAVSNRRGSDGTWKEPAIEHLETGHAEGVSPENDPISDDVKTTFQAQQEREKKLDKGHDSMDIKPNEYEQEYTDKTQKPAGGRSFEETTDPSKLSDI